MAGGRAAAAREDRLGRMARSIQAWQRALGQAAAGGAVLEVGELVGSVVPAAPSRSLLNAAAAPRGAVLGGDVLAELDVRYAAAGVTAWAVWAHEDEAATATALEAAGLVVDSRPAAMALALDALAAEPPRPRVTVEPTRELPLLARPLGAAYGFPEPFLAQAVPRLLEHGAGWLARVDGEPAAGAVVVRAGDDSGVFLVGTAPRHRGQGVAGTLLHTALARAREDGCATSTLQASAMGRPVYARLGYQEAGRYLLWERRRPVTAG